MFELDFLSSPSMGSIIGIVGVVVGIVGIIVGYVLYRRTKTNKQPLYCISTDTLFEKSNPRLPSEIQVQFRGEDIKLLKRTTMLFFNNGKTSIRGSDLYEDDKLRLRFNDGMEHILQITSAQTSKVGESFTTSNTDNAINISFDAIQKSQGFVISVVHTSPKKDPVTLLGGIDGVKKVKRIPKQRMDMLLYQDTEEFKKRIKRQFAVAGIALIILAASLCIPLGGFGVGLATLSMLMIAAYGMPTLFEVAELATKIKYEEFARLVESLEEI